MNLTLPVVLIHREGHEREELRHALESRAEVKIVGERGDLRGGLTLARQTKPALLVAELLPPFAENLQTLAQFRLEQPDCALVVVADGFDQALLHDAMRAGAQDMLRRPVNRPALLEAVGRVAQQHARREGVAGTARGIVAVFSTKGGTGVSTIAANLAISCRRRTGKEVALVDLDYQSGDVAFLLGLSPVRSFGDVIGAPRLDSAVVQQALLKDPSGVHVLSQPEHLGATDGARPEAVGKSLEILAAMFDLVVVDAPHAVNDLSVEIFDRASQILLVVEPSLPSVRSARRSLEVFRKLDYLTSGDRVRLIVNRAGERSAITVAEIEKTLELPVFATIANDFLAVSAAINAGRPLCGGKTTSRAGQDIEALAGRLLEGENGTAGPAAPEAPERPSGLLGRLFGRHGKDRSS